MICDNALVSGFAAGRRVIGAGLVYEVCKDFDLSPPEAKDAAMVARTPARGAATPGRRIAPYDNGGDAQAVTREARPESSGSSGLFSVFNRPRRFSFF